MVKLSFVREFVISLGVLSEELEGTGKPFIELAALEGVLEVRLDC